MPAEGNDPNIPEPKDPKQTEAGIPEPKDPTPDIPDVPEQTPEQYQNEHPKGPF